jgi:hypothetical protein
MWFLYAPFNDDDFSCLAGCFLVTVDFQLSCLMTTTKMPDLEDKAAWQHFVMAKNYELVQATKNLINRSSSKSNYYYLANSANHYLRHRKIRNVEVGSLTIFRFCCSW